MSLKSYLFNNEQKYADVRATERKGPFSDYTEGTLAVSSNRLVFIGDDGSIKDFSLDSVDAFEFEPPQTPWESIIASFISIFLGLAFFAFQETFSELLSESTISGVGMILIILGILIVAWGYLMRRSVLSIHTPSESFRFTSADSDLTPIIHAVRGQTK